jgi:hypothetical protein
VPSKKMFFASILLSVLISFTLISLVGASSELWSQTYGGANREVAYALVETPDGGYALGGDTNSFGLKWETEGWLVKTDANGNMQWNKTYSRSIRSLIVTSDGGYALTGSGQVFKTDAYGNVEWNRTYGGVSLVETSDGGFALAGSKNDDFSLVKIDAYGNREWSRTYGGAEVERAHSLVEASEGGFALAGGTIVSEGNGYRASRFWLVKTDEYGNMLWNQTYGIANDEAYSLVRTSDGGFALAGITYIWDPANLGVGNYDFWLVKTDANGVMEWNRTYARTDGDKVHSLIVTSDGGYALAGESYTETFGEGIEHDFWLVKTDGYGNVEWNQTYGGANREVAYALVETSDGGYALAGYTNSFGAGGNDFWLIKTDAQGIPEFPSWTPLLISLVAVVVVAVVYRRRLSKSQGETFK